MGASLESGRQLVRSPDRRLVSLADESDADRFIDVILPGVQAAGTPYDDWLFGGRDQAWAALRESMRRPSSELFIGRATLCMVEDVPVGGIIALGGRELAACLVADAVAALKQAGPEGRSAAMKRIRDARQLTPPVEEDEFYLSRIWVSPEAQGSGHAIALVREYLASGRRRGFTRFRADICSTNTGVLRLAEFFKFQVLGEGVCAEAEMAYTSIRREFPQPVTALCNSAGEDA